MGLIFNRHKKKEVLEDENSIKEGRQEQQDLKDKKEEVRKRLHLFSIDAGLEDDLNKNTVSEGLKEGFKTGGFPLSKDTDISEKGDDKWMITDKREEKSYIVWKEDGKLNIYRGTKISQEKSLDDDKFAGFLTYVLTDGNIKHHLEIIRRKTKCPAHLCIFASKAKIYVYVTVAKYKNVFDSLAIKSPSHNAFSSEMCINMMKCLGSVPINKPDKLKKDWEGCIRDSNENIIKDYGEDLWKELIPKDIEKTLKTELESDNDKIKDVWIFCEDKNIDFLWEWIYWKEKNFFWGDEFSIIRIEKGCDMSECLVKKEIFILANERDSESGIFVKNLKLKLQDAGVNDSNLKIIKSPEWDFDVLPDCILLYAAGKDKRIRGSYESKLNRIFIEKKILFFDLYPTLGPLGVSVLPAAWINSRFENIREEIMLTFVICFFKAYAELFKEGRKVRVTEIIAKTRVMMKGEPILWRLGCVVNGNPRITLTA
jgi:hypothetical protein